MPRGRRQTIEDFHKNREDQGHASLRDKHLGRQHETEINKGPASESEGKHVEMIENRAEPHEQQKLKEDESLEERTSGEEGLDKEAEKKVKPSHIQARAKTPFARLMAQGRG